MLKKLRSPKTQGFTLIELLVVIAIIGILAALLFPAISGALDKARAIKAGNVAKQIHLAIYSVSLDREAVGQSDVWPRSAPDPTAGEGDYTDSTGYIEWLVEGQIMEAGIPAAEYDMRFFAVQGVNVQSSIDDWDGDSNPWCVVSDLTAQRSPDSMPFIFTRNIVNYDTTDQTPDLDEDENPFGDTQAIILTKGGALNIIGGDLFDPDNPNYDEDRLNDTVNPSGRTRDVLRNQ